MDKQKVLSEKTDTTNVSIVSADDMAKVYYHSGLPDKNPDMTNENLKQNHSNRYVMNNKIIESENRIFLSLFLYLNVCE